MSYILKYVFPPQVIFYLILTDYILHQTSLLIYFFTCPVLHLPLYPDYVAVNLSEILI
jgi:hypothetical protein